MLNTRADDVALGHGDDVGHAVPGVDDDPGESPVLGLSASPAGCEGEDGLDSDVEAGDVETLEHDLRCVFSVLRSVQWRLGEKEVVVLWLSPMRGIKIRVDKEKVSLASNI